MSHAEEYAIAIRLIKISNLPDDVKKLVVDTLNKQYETRNHYLIKIWDVNDNPIQIYADDNLSSGKFEMIVYSDNSPYDAVKIARREFTKKGITFNKLTVGHAY